MMGKKVSSTGGIKWRHQQGSLSTTRGSQQRGEGEAQKSVNSPTVWIGTFSDLESVGIVINSDHKKITAKLIHPGIGITGGACLPTLLKQAARFE
jgi:hypothetical protein